MPLDMPEEGSCSFCAYLAGDLPYVILEHGHLASILVTREQRGIGHVLVIPTAHRPTILDVAQDEAAAVMDAVVRVARAIAAAYDPEGISVWQNNGKPSSQSIPHLHVHVTATLPGGGTDWGKVPTISLDEADAIRLRLAPHLALPDH